MSATLAPAESVCGPLTGAGEPAPAPRSISLQAGVELARSSWHGLSRARVVLARTQTFGPALVVAMVLGLAVGPGVAAFRGNPTGFVRFGREFVPVTHPPAGAVIDRWTGYDGQYFWVLALDPLLARHRTVAAFSDQGFRLGRIGYPALAYALAGGQEDAVPWSLLAVNVIAVLALTLAFAVHAQRRGWSGWWALGVGLLPGLLFVTMGDLSGAVAVAFMLGGLMACERDRRWLAAGLLGAAGLTREPMLLAVVAVAVEAGARWWPVRRSPGALRRTVGAVWPVLVIPAVVFLAWRGYVQVRLGSGTMPPATAFELPMFGLLRQIPGALQGGLTVTGIWDLAYLAGIFAGIGAALALVRRTLSAPAVAAALFGLVLLVLPFGSDWGYARESTPMFAALLLAGLGTRTRPAITVGVAVSVLGALVPLMVG
jgi:hypothetical protein